MMMAYMQTSSRLIVPFPWDESERSVFLTMTEAKNWIMPNETQEFVK